MPGLEADLTLLRDVVAEAAELALGHFGNRPKVWQKEGGLGPVTEADLAVDKLLRKRLLAARPDHGWLSEETTDDPVRLSHRRCFVVDPIDGTTSFIKGKPGWAISVGLVEDGVPVAGVIAQPVTKTEFTAALGHGAWRNGERLAPDWPLEGASLAIPRPQLDAVNWPGGVPVEPVVHGGALALRLARLAVGDIAGTVTFRRVWEWDIAAGAVLAAEAGARLTDRHGAALRFNSPPGALDGLVAAGPVMHDRLMARIAPGDS
ncbi:3'(2'),5'-bisphosphate nucleotidase CysQ [Roseobacter sp. HKCCA0434]|uniref:3'(2'),5'-bisphosphate nucleotidase CysQ n=1 Tax=Roseobacter sp. HKCCA0434 TaxID=3079297 RepID=UPI002905DDDC|nr:3'(2'),5'-bisphosphate nucleotidase CysQ [Roseobacter sp. HKCCA0434]